MPFINGRYYMNPAYGRELEQARVIEDQKGSSPPKTQAPQAPPSEIVRQKPQQVEKKVIIDYGESRIASTEGL
jgi:hypothetical protein